VEASVLLCDHAVVAEGKFYINGGGWDGVTSQTGPMTLAILIRVNWDETNNRLPLKVCLVDEDGNSVTQPGPEGADIVVEARGEFEVGRPPGTKRGSTVTTPLAIPFAPMKLEPDRGYEWRVEIDGNTITRAPFRTFPTGFRPPPPK
jgi:hypothetical protein